MTNSEQAIREIAEKHFPCVGTRNDREYRKMEQDALVSSITALISEHYVSKEKHEELLRQRDELKKALISLMWQFAYYGTKNNVAVMHTGGLSALEDAFSALGLSDPITVENFEAAIKNTETK